jgi:chorismate dehydratase
MIRISFSDYLNSVPLGWAFLHGLFKNRLTVSISPPARCAEQLACGEADIALIPSVEYQRIRDLRIIPGMSVASNSSVRSVLMVQPREAGKIGSVALDTSSRTSVVLARLLLETRMGLRPDYLPAAPDLTEMLHKCDAAVIIGDKALRVSPEDYRVTDLAQEWIRWQQKPFVFAFWACRSDWQPPDDLNNVFEEAKSFGLAARPEIAANYARMLQLPEPFLRQYLYNNVDYRLGPLHIEGLERFYRLAWEHNLTAGLWPIRFLFADTRPESSSPCATEIT